MRRVLGALLVSVAIASVVPAHAAQEPERTHESSHFSITWVDDPASAHAPDLRDADGSGVPDAIERALTIFEEARAFLIGALGYKEPPVDGLYPLYVAEPGGPGYVRTSPGGTGRSKPSFILIPPSVIAPGASDDRIRIFVVHEYFHAVQVGYDSDEDHWITEATATWVEDVFVDDANNDRTLLSHFVPYPRVALTDTSGLHEYGAFLFVRFLVERFGGDPGLVRELWEEMAVPEGLPGAPNRDSLGAIEAVLARRGVALSDAWGEFLLWRWEPERFEEGEGYRSALLHTDWPAVLRASHVRSESCRLTTDVAPGDLLPSMSGEYVRLVPDTSLPARASATLTVEGPTGSTGFVRVKPRGSPALSFPLIFDSDGIASTAVDFGRARTRNLVVGLGNSNIDGPPASIAYSLRVMGRDKTTAPAPSGNDTTFFGVGTRISGSVSCRGFPAPAADVVVTETERVSGEQKTFALETNTSGVWSFSAEPDVNASYSVEVVDPLLGSATSDSFDVGVRVFVTIQITNDRVNLGESIGVSGNVLPVHAEAPVVVEYRRPERAWQRGAATTVDEGGTYSTSLALPRAGVWEVRARVEDTLDDDHLPATSLSELIRVR